MCILCMRCMCVSYKNRSDKKAIISLSEYAKNALQMRPIFALLLHSFCPHQKRDKPLHNRASRLLRIVAPGVRFLHYLCITFASPAKRRFLVSF